MLPQPTMTMRPLKAGGSGDSFGGTVIFNSRASCAMPVSAGGSLVVVRGGPTLYVGILVGLVGVIGFVMILRRNAQAES